MDTLSPWDVAEPRERDWKEYVEPQLTHDSTKFDRAILTTDCPACGKRIGALIVDGPDPVFVDLVCPRDACGEEWSERVK